MMGKLRVWKRRICSFGQQILVRVPEIDVRLVVLRIFRLFALDLREALLLLISHPGGLSGFATNQHQTGQHRGSQLKLFHT